MADPAAVATIFVSIGAAGNIALFLSQGPMVLQMIREGDAARYTWLPSLTLMSTLSFWSGYTSFLYSPVDRVDLYVGNFSGIVIPFVFLCAFVAMSKGWRAKATIVGATLAALAVTWAISVGIFLSGTPNAVYISGGVTVACNLTFFASPLKAIHEAIARLDASRLPLLLSVVQVFQSLPWIIAGVLIKDYFILGVNATGEVFALVQLAGVAYISVRRKQLKLASGEAFLKGEVEALVVADGDAAATAPSLPVDDVVLAEQKVPLEAA
jgi:solute carrier family 50 protein (sugar transporter)